MSTTIRLDADASAIIKQDHPTENFHSGTRELLGSGAPNYYPYYLFVAFEDIDSAYQYKEFESAVVNLYLVPVASPPPLPIAVRVESLSKTWDENTITYNNAPMPSSSEYYWDETSSTNTAAYVSGRVVFIKNAARYGLVISGYNDANWINIDTARSTNKPYINISFSDDNAKLGITNLQPTGGYVSRNAPITCSWKTSQGNCIGTLSQVSGIFRYRTSAEVAATEIPLTNEQSVTLPVGTITTSSFQWQIELTSNAGTTTTSEWYTLNTAEPLPVATAVSPKNVVVDGSAPVIFSWAHTISTGTLQTKAELQISTNNSQWSSLTTVNGAANTYTAPANTLSSGTVYWRVRTYNTDNAASEWSEALSIIVVAAPEKPVIATDSEPRLTVSWQAEEQQAYQVQIDDYDSGVLYGVEKQFIYPDYLSDGIHIVRVRVQNSYSLFSEWATAEISITNTPGPTIVLTAQHSNTTVLSWDSSGYDAYNVYRDSKLVGYTTQLQFTDQFATNGNHQYVVRGIFNDSGNYGDSNSVTINVVIKNLMLFDVDGRQWLDVPMSRKSGGTTISVNVDVNYVHYSGNELPSAEISKDKERIYNIAPVFLFNKFSDSYIFESMIGKLIYLKDAYGTGMFGILSGYDVTANNYRRMYSARVLEVAVDEVDVNG